MLTPTLALFGFPVGWGEVLVILLAMLLLFGGKKLPELARGLGRGLREFRREMQGIKEEFHDAVDEEPKEEQKKDQT